MDFVLGFQKHFLLPVLTGTDGFVNEPGSLGFRGADFPLSHLLPVENTGGEAGGGSHQSTQNDQKDQIPFHNLKTHLLLKIGAEGVALIPM